MLILLDSYLTANRVRNLLARAAVKPQWSRPLSRLARRARQLNSSLDYYSLDQEDESTLNRLIQEQLGRGRVRRRERPKATVPERAPQLPSGMLGSGQLLASQKEVAAPFRGPSP